MKAELRRQKNEKRLKKKAKRLTNFIVKRQALGDLIIHAIRFLYQDDRSHTPTLTNVCEGSEEMLLIPIARATLALLDVGHFPEI